MFKALSSANESRKDFERSLDETASECPRRFLVQALKLEAEEYVSQNKKEIDDNGHRLVVRNGVGQSRSLTLGSGAIEIKAPVVNDRREGEDFLSTILPPYLRKSPKVESLLPIRCLTGLSTRDFQTSLSKFLGKFGSSSWL